MFSSRKSKWLSVAVLSIVVSVGFFLILSKPGDLQAKAATEKKQPVQNLTILSLEPNVTERRVTVRFNMPVEVKELEDQLSFRPYAYIQWYDAKQIAQDVISISAEFRYGQKYFVEFTEGFSSGGATYTKTKNDFFMPDLPPSADFTERKTVIERDSRQMIHLKTVNVDSVVVRTLKIPPVLLPFAMAAVEGSWDAAARKSLARLQEIGGEIEAAVGRDPALAPLLGEVREESGIYPTAHEKNVEKAFSIPLSFRKDSGRGSIELVTVEPQEAKESPKPLLVRITDLGLSYKRSSGDLLVWATSIRSASPLAGISILAVTKDKEFFNLGKTDDRGILTYGANATVPADFPGISLKDPTAIKYIRGTPPVSNIVALLGSTQDDVSFIDLKPLGNVDVSNLEPKPGSWAELELLRGKVFTERGAYRPGETVFFKGTVRQYAERKIGAPNGKRCTFKLSDPRGDVIKESSADLSDFGTASGSIKIEPFRPLGTYSLEMSFGAETAASTTFQVQEFRAPRHFVKVGFERFTHTSNEYVNMERTEDRVRIKITGSYYAGGPVKNGRVRWVLYHAKAERSVEGYPDYDFGYESEDEDELLETGESNLNDRGELDVEFPLDRDILSGKRALLATATVIDFDGRASAESGTFQVEPEYLVGIERHPEKIEPNERQKLKLLVLDKDRKTVPEGVLRAEVLERSYTSIPMRNGEGNLDWEYEDVWRKKLSADLPINNGSALFEVDFGTGGRYLLSFTYQGGGQKAVGYTSATVYSVAGDMYSIVSEGDDKGFDVLSVDANKERYAPGETAVIYVAPPRPVASFLVTVEQDGILSHQVLDAQTVRGGIRIPIHDRYMPNIYVSVIGLAPRGDFPLYSGRYDFEAPRALFGSVKIPVQRNAEVLSVKIGEGSGELRARPGEPYSIDLEVSGGESELAVGVVNEAVLALTGYETPELSSLLEFEAPLGVATGELRTMLLHQTPFHVLLNRPLTGGDGGDDGALGLKIRKNFTPVAYFNPSVRTDQSGRARVSFTLPDTMTAYRIYVVACDRGARFGNGERMLTVTKDFYIEPGLPAFFTRGDRFRFPVAAFNNSASEGNVRIDVTASNQLKIATGSSSAQLAANSSEKLPVEGEAVSAGDAQVRAVGAFRDAKDGVEIGLPVTKGQVLGTEAAVGSFIGSAPLSLGLKKETLAIPWGKTGYEDVSGSILISPSPLLLLSGPLRYLLHYPYGCVEQTSSATLALAGLRGVIAQGAVPGITIEETDRFLTRGVERLLSMQLQEGGFGYWPGYARPHPWGSLYAVSALAIAGKNGFPVPQERLESALGYLKKRIEEKDESIQYRAFAAYVLSLAGGLGKEEFASVYSDATGNGPERLFLVLAGINSGMKPDPRNERVVRDALKVKQKEDKVFNARYREAALALLAASALIPDDPATAEAAETLVRGLDGRDRWTSTSDTGWTLFALGRYYKKISGKGQGGEIQVIVTHADGRKEPVTVTFARAGAVQLDPKEALSGAGFTLSSDSDQKLYYRAHLTFPRLDYAVSGHDGGFSVRKKIESADGGERIRVGDLVKVTLTVDTGKGEKRYAILDDPLPAGLMAINSAFKTEEPTPEDPGGGFMSVDGLLNFEPNFLEIGEQHVVAFRDSLWEGSYRFVYYARAVCEGEFNVPPTKVELMYEPEVNGFTQASRLKVEGPAKAGK
ncbi:MAG: alpha-2-macroglobulin family protein [Acidobacteriota bacterium]